tara:strand:- start:1040 stop:1471 length:432 start_codon:yes stop_codon:yes gene_type:complete
MNDKRPWIGFNEAAELCGVCVQTIRNHEKRGAFRSRWFSQLGLRGGRLIERKSLLEWAKARKRPGRTPQEAVEAEEARVGFGSDVLLADVALEMEDTDLAETTPQPYLPRILMVLECILYSLERVHEWQKRELMEKLEGKGGL